MSPRRPCLEKAIAIVSELRSGAGSSPRAIRSPPIWVGRTWHDRSDGRTGGAARSEPTMEDPWATRLGGVYLLTGISRLAGRVRIGADLNPNFSLWPKASMASHCLLRQWETGHRGHKPRPANEPTRSVRALYYGVASYAQFVGRIMMRKGLAREAIRLRGDYVGGHRLSRPRSWRTGGIAAAALEELRRASPIFRSLDRKPDAVQAGRRPRPLCGSFRRAGPKLGVNHAARNVHFRATQPQ